MSELQYTEQAAAAYGAERIRAALKPRGRLFVDATENLTDPSSRQMLVNVLGRSDPLVQDALETVLASGFLGDRDRTPVPGVTEPPAVAPHPAPPIANDPQLVVDLIAKSRESIARLTESIRGRSGSELLDFIDDAIRRRLAVLAQYISPEEQQRVKKTRPQWRALLERAERLMADGVPPHAPAARELALDWRALMDRTVGRDAALGERLLALYENEPLLQAGMAFTPALRHYIQQSAGP